MKKNKNKVIIFKSLFLLAVFFLSYNFSLASGCCVIDPLITGDPGNCDLNSTDAAKCTSDFGFLAFYVDNDFNCNCTSTTNLHCTPPGTPLVPCGGGGGGGGGSYVVTCDPGYNKVGNVCFPSSTTVALPNPTDGPLKVLSNVLSWILGIFGVIAIIAFLISGIQYLTSAGDEDQAKTAKRNATYAIVGVMVGLSGVIILQAVNAALEGTSSLF